MWVLVGFISFLATRVSTTDPVFNSLSVEEAFRFYGIVPQVVPVAPQKRLNVILDDGYIVNLGTKIPAYATIIEPLESWDAKDDSLYTLINFDADYPQRLQNNGTQYLHGLIINIPGSNVPLGDQLSRYVPAISLPGTGYHRYIGLVYEQQQYIDINLDDLISITTDIGNFSVLDFVNYYNLGSPIFGNFFLSQLSLQRTQLEEYGIKYCD